MAATTDDIMAALQEMATHFGAKLESVRSELKGDIAALDTKLSGEIAAVRTELSGEIEQLRHVTSANHFRVIGRIDQVASMLADHMADPHGPPPPSRKSA